ncbi:MAG: MerR family transcriptional regulator [Acidobacteriota bacterium]
MGAGELAEHAGISIRTLHYWEEIGLLVPARNIAGHRRYGRVDLDRLTRILSLRQLGFSLDEIGEVLDRPGFSLVEVLRLQVARTEARLAEVQRLRDRLRDLTASLERSSDASVDMLIDTMEVLQMFEQYYTPEQLAQLKARREAIGEDGMRAAEARWAELFTTFREARDGGLDPADPSLDEAVATYDDLVRAFTGGDPGIEQSLGTMYREQPDTPARFGMDVDRELMAYMGRARAARSDR